MTSSNQQLQSYLPLYDTVPQGWQEARQKIVEDLRLISDAVNAREIGWYIQDQVITGKQCFSTVSASGLNDLGRSNVYRTIFRKVIDFGALPNTAVKTVPHGILFNANFTLIHLYASATDPVGFTAFTLPGANSSIEMDATKIIVTTTSNLSNYTRCIVVIEYLLET